MVSKKYWKSSIDEFTDLVKQQKNCQRVEIMGASFDIFPGVFSPIYSSDTAWFASKISDLVQEKTFLEIGSGSGVIACIAALHGASRVVATDINPVAVENICFNASRHSLPIDVRLGSVFDPIMDDEVFDVIFWNHPFYCTEDPVDRMDMLAMSVYDENYRFLEDFLLKGRDHLKQDGKLILGTSNIARISKIKKIAASGGMHVTLMDSTEAPVHKKRSAKMELRLYAFRP